MTVRSSRERWLLGATIASGLLVLISHGGGLSGCSTTVRQVEVRTVRAPLGAGQQPELVLTAQGSGPHRPRVARIERGTLVVLRWRRDEGGAGESEGALAGFEPTRRRVLFTADGETIQSIDADRLSTLEVLGESPTSGYAGNGALIGGLSGAAIGAAAGASVGGSYGGLCAAGFGASGGLLASGIGAGIGAIASPGRPRREYRLGPSDWQVASEQPRTAGQPDAPWSRPQSGSGGEAP